MSKKTSAALPELKKPEAIQKDIASIKSRGKKLDKDIHAAGIQALLHFEKHGDTVFLTGLYEAIPKSGRKKAFVVWVEAHSPAIQDGKSKVFTKDKSRKANAFRVDAAMDTPYWEFTEESVTLLGADNVYARLNGIVKQIENKISSNQYEKDDLETLMQQHEAILGLLPETMQLEARERVAKSKSNVPDLVTKDEAKAA